MGKQMRPTIFAHQGQFNNFRVGKINSETSSTILRMKFDQLVTWNKVLKPHDIEKAFIEGRFQDQG